MGPKWGCSGVGVIGSHIIPLWPHNGSCMGPEGGGGLYGVSGEVIWGLWGLYGVSVGPRVVV